MTKDHNPWTAVVNLVPPGTEPERVRYVVIDHECGGIRSWITNWDSGHRDPEFHMTEEDARESIREYEKECKDRGMQADRLAVAAVGTVLHDYRMTCSIHTPK
jgi:hypothetical protein